MNKPYRIKMFEDTGRPIVDIKDEDPVKLLDKVQTIVKKFK